MIDRDSIELAGLKAVSLLDDDELASFTHECRVNPEMRRATAEMCDLVAAVAAATTPPAAPPPHALAGIYARLAAGASASPPQGSAALPQRAASAGRRTPTARTWLPWAAAASFAMLSTWLGWRTSTLETRWNQAHRSGTGNADADGSGSDNASTGTNTSRGDPRPGDTRTGPTGNKAASGSPASQRVARGVRLLQDPGQLSELRNEVSRLRLAEQARQQLPPGMSEFRVVEMLPPGISVAPEKRGLLTTRLGTAIANGLQAPADPATPLPPTGSTDQIEVQPLTSKPGSDIVIKGEAVPPLSLFNLAEDAQVRHQNFPPREKWEGVGLIALDERTAFDGRGGVWHQSQDGREWIGQSAPANWTPPEPGEPFEGQTPPLRQGAGDALASPQPENPDTGLDPATPFAWPLLDHQDRGTFIVQNLPPAPEGHLYHLWITDSLDPTPHNVGALPPGSAGHDIFDFDSAGLIPSAYQLTLEKIGPVTTPGKVVLQYP